MPRAQSPVARTRHGPVAKRVVSPRDPPVQPWVRVPQPCPLVRRKKDAGQALFRIPSIVYIRIVARRARRDRPRGVARLDIRRWA